VRERLKFLGLVCGAATLPMVAQAQQSERLRRIGVLIGGAETDPEQGQRMGSQAISGHVGISGNIDFGFEGAHYNDDRTASSKRPGLQSNLSTGPIRVLIELAPKQVGRKEPLCSYLKFYKETH
jgi:hypothetical protein